MQTVHSYRSKVTFWLIAVFQPTIQNILWMLKNKYTLFSSVASFWPKIDYIITAVIHKISYFHMSLFPDMSLKVILQELSTIFIYCYR